MSIRKAFLLHCYVALAAAVCWAQPLQPTIRVNNSIGIATPGASGAPSALGPFTIVAGCDTGGVSSTTINWTAHGMTATIPTDGTALLYMTTPSGRRWTQITAFPTVNTITVETAINDGGAARSCAVGGILNALPCDETQLWEDLQFGWTMTVDNTGTAYAHTTSCGNKTVTGGNLSNDGRVVMQGSTLGTPTEYTFNVNGAFIGRQDSLKIQDLILNNISGGAAVGEALLLGANTPVMLRIRVAGNWRSAYDRATTQAGGNIMILSEVLDTLEQCERSDRNEDMIANFYSACGPNGSGYAFGPGQGVAMYNVVVNSTLGAFGGSHILHNTMNGSVGACLATSGVITSQFGALKSGNLCTNDTGAGAAWTATASFPNYAGGTGGGFAHQYDGGNSFFGNTGANFDAAVTASQWPASTLTLEDPLYTSVGTLDFFPLNANLKTALAYPGSAAPFLTAATPTSTTTAGAAQLFGAAAGASAYAF